MIKSAKDVLGLEEFKWHGTPSCEVPYHLQAASAVPKCEHGPDEQRIPAPYCANKGFAKAAAVRDMNVAGLKITSGTKLDADGIRAGGKSYAVQELIVHARRYDCQKGECGARNACSRKSFTESFDALPAGAVRTTRLDNTISNLSLVKSFLSVSKATQTDENTVRRLFDEKVRAEDMQRSWVMPVTLGIHCLQLAGEPYYAFIDVENDRLLELAAISDVKRIRRFAGYMRSAEGEHPKIIVGLDEAVQKELLPLMFGTDCKNELMVERWYVLRAAKEGALDELQGLLPEHKRMYHAIEKKLDDALVTSVSSVLEGFSMRENDLLRTEPGFCGAIEQFEILELFYLADDLMKKSATKKKAFQARGRWLEDALSECAGGLQAKEKILAQKAGVVAYARTYEGSFRFGAGSCGHEKKKY